MSAKIHQSLLNSFINLFDIIVLLTAYETLSFIFLFVIGGHRKVKNDKSCVRLATLNKNNDAYIFDSDIY